MTHTFNFSLQGKRHIEQGKPCQDFSFVQGFGAWKILAVADGVSSSVNSQLASEKACKTAVEFVKSAFPFDEYSHTVIKDDIDKVLVSAMHAAQNSIEEYANETATPYSDYDTTLVLCLFGGSSAYISVVGDSGAVVLKKDGDIEHTEPMNDSQGHVFPLRFRGAYKTYQFDSVAAVALMTDGIFKDSIARFGVFDKNAAAEYFPMEIVSEEPPEDSEEFIECFKKAVAERLEKNEFLFDDMSIALAIEDDEPVKKIQFSFAPVVEQLYKESVIYGEQALEIFKKKLQKFIGKDFTDEEIEKIFKNNGKMEEKNGENSASLNTVRVFPNTLESNEEDDDDDDDDEEDYEEPDFDYDDDDVIWVDKNSDDSDIENFVINNSHSLSEELGKLLETMFSDSNE